MGCNSKWMRVFCRISHHLSWSHALDDQTEGGYHTYYEFWLLISTQNRKHCCFHVTQTIWTGPGVALVHMELMGLGNEDLIWQREPEKQFTDNWQDEAKLWSECFADLDIIKAPKLESNSCKCQYSTCSSSITAHTHLVYFSLSLEMA